MQIEQVIRVLCIGMVVLSNVVMVNMFAKAMDLAGSVNATVMNTAANFFFSVCIAADTDTERHRIKQSLKSTLLRIVLFQSLVN